MNKRDLNTFLTERNEALRSMDIDRVVANIQKYSPDFPTPYRDIVEIGMHKARTACTALSHEERAYSKHWLKTRGFKSMDDGDVGEFKPQ